MSGTRPDAVVIGAGPNGLVAANHLADAGWSVLVLEAGPQVGGAVHSSRDVHPEYVHDTASAFYPLAAASPAITSLHLEDHGLRWRHAPAVLGHPTPDGQWAILHRDREVTASSMEAQHAGDGDAWLRLCEQWDHIGDHLVTGLVTPFPPVRAAASGLPRLPGAGGLRFVKELLSPVQQLVHDRFGGRSPRLLLAGNAGHADIPFDATGSSVMALVLTMLGQTVGHPVPEGGAHRLALALTRRLESLGGEIRCDTRVTGIDVVDGRAARVRTAEGEAIPAGRAVVATVGATALYGSLLDAQDVPTITAKGMERFEMDPATVKVDWALDQSVPWGSAPPFAPGTVHIADSLEQMTESLDQVAAGAVPAAPFMLAGQMTTTDPTRSPAGTESMWAYAHVPQTTRSDAGDGGIRGEWGRDDCERFADRMQARIERLAPGFGSRITARRILGPHELQAHDANLIGGAINGGTARLRQQLVLRPVPGAGRAETGIRGLYLGSASAHPGGGVHGAPGANAARAALAHARVRGFLPW